MMNDPIRPASWVHPKDCPCRTCRDLDPALVRPLGFRPFAGHCLAGIVVGNAIAFAYDWRAALSALAACFGVVR